MKLIMSGRAAEDGSREWGRGRGAGAGTRRALVLTSWYTDTAGLLHQLQVRRTLGRESTIMTLPKAVSDQQALSLKGLRRLFCGRLTPNGYRYAFDAR